MTRAEAKARALREIVILLSPLTPEEALAVLRQAQELERHMPPRSILDALSDLDDPVAPSAPAPLPVFHDIAIKGWNCRACRRFNGEEQAVVLACNSCTAPRPTS